MLRLEVCDINDVDNVNFQFLISDGSLTFLIEELLREFLGVWNQYDVDRFLEFLFFAG